MLRRLSFYLPILMICLIAAPGVVLCSAQTLQWSASKRFDQGAQTNVAIHSSGLIVEVHRTHVLPATSLWYHIGRMNGTTVSWSASHGLPVAGAWPNVAISPEGYLLLVYSTGTSKGNSDLYYLVGKIDPYGSVDQTIQWVRGKAKWDSGFHSSTAINSNGTIVGVHESGSGGKGLYYRVGHFANPASGDFKIVWDSGSGGVKFDDGINPHIAINDLNQVVEVHQVTNDNYLHYRRGTLSGGTISFGGSPRFDSNAFEPSVALLNNGTVIEVDSSSDIYARTGALSPANRELIDWSPKRVKLSDASSTEARYPSVASNGFEAVSTWASYTVDITGVLYYSVAQLP